MQTYKWFLGLIGVVLVGVGVAESKKIGLTPELQNDAVVVIGPVPSVFHETKGFGFIKKPAEVRKRPLSTLKTREKLNPKKAPVVTSTIEVDRVGKGYETNVSDLADDLLLQQRPAGATSEVEGANTRDILGGRLDEERKRKVYKSVGGDVVEDVSRRGN